MEVLISLSVSRGHCRGLFKMSDQFCGLGMPMIDRFHQDPNTWIFLISTLAGGTGLNLVGANKVVIFGGFILVVIITTV
jgi:hypothetical protein